MATRREFLRLSAAAAAAGAAGLLSRRALGAEDPEARRKALEKPLPKRALGRTGIEVSCVGLGCFYLGLVREGAAAERVVRRARDLGVNWFDTAPSYGPAEGVSEERVGRGLKGVRDGVHVATKTLKRDAKGLRQELEGSLRRLGTDRVDLLQFHAIRTARDVEAVFREGGAHEGALAAVKAGKVLHVGFTGHFDPEVLAAVCRDRPVETVLMPLNCLDPLCTGPGEKSFEAGALPAARERGLGVVAMKVFSSGRLVDDPAASPAPRDCLRYVLGLPVSTAIVGCSTVEELEEDLAAAKSFEPMTGEEVEALRRRVKPFLARKVEWYKR